MGRAVSSGNGPSTALFAPPAYPFSDACWVCSLTTCAAFLLFALPLRFFLGPGKHVTFLSVFSEAAKWPELGAQMTPVDAA